MKFKFLSILTSFVAIFNAFYEIEWFGIWMRMNSSMFYPSTGFVYDPLPYIYFVFKIGIILYLGRLTVKIIPMKEKIFSDELYPIY